MSKLTLAIPSKGRLMEQTTGMFARAGLVVRKVGHVRGYRGEIEELPGIDVAYVPSSEIAEALKAVTRRFSNPRRTGPAPWKPAVALSGPTSLPIAFDT